MTAKVENNSSVYSFLLLTTKGIFSLNRSVLYNPDLTNLARCGQHKDATLLSWDVVDPVGGLQASTLFIAFLFISSFLYS